MLILANLGQPYGILAEILANLGQLYEILAEIRMGYKFSPKAGFYNFQNQALHAHGTNVLQII